MGVTHWAYWKANRAVVFRFTGKDPDGLLTFQHVREGYIIRRAVSDFAADKEFRPFCIDTRELSRMEALIAYL